MDKAFAKLTVCIITKDNPANIIRQINYYSKYAFPVIILDASIRPISKIENQNIIYHHLPELPFHKRLIFLGECVMTEFMVLQADDDFHGARGLLKNLNFLIRNPEYCCSQGTFIRIQSERPLFWWPDYKNQNSLRIDNDESSIRIKEFALANMHFVYSVMATATFRKITSCFDNVQTGILLMNELAFNFTLGLFGKYRTMPGFYSARDKSHGPSSMDFIQWENSGLISDYLQFKRNLVDLYIQYGNLTEIKAQSLLNGIIKAFKERDLSKKQFNALRIHNMGQWTNIKNATRKINLFGTRPFSSALFRFSSWNYVFTLILHNSLFIFLLDFMEIRKVLRKDFTNI